ncbi:cell wall hydrolase [Falcatimonas sp. MSJ-15]|uniref:cell wall hydrolase n=1 Tax=Falcatimonas sp. MSJ-15 TaxID=2841515 RepID=UPI001C0F52DD|nr:cell wall hydrolase [Falcatimonas sp. MSJ-15]MBU5471341.1 cell wall hydrolase [Falcatimonas sp. MSJ-15]
MLNIRSFFQNIFLFVKNLSKRVYRNCVVMTTGACVFAIVVLNSTSFGGGGRNNTNVYARTLDTESESEDEDVSENTETEMNGTIQFGLVNSALQEQSITEHLSAIGSSKEEETEEAVADKETNENLISYQSNDLFSEDNDNDVALIDYSESDYQALLRIVEAEATGLDIKAKILVANVVINRVMDEHFPGTVEGVVYSREGGSYQFSPLSDGRFYNVIVTDTTIEAVDRALYGEDYSQGALFFAARKSASNANMSWFDRNLTRLFEYHGHEFFTFR